MRRVRTVSSGDTIWVPPAKEVVAARGGMAMVGATAKHSVQLVLGIR